MQSLFGVLPRLSVDGTFRTSQPDSGVSAVGGRAEVVIASPDFRVWTHSGHTPQIASRFACSFRERSITFGQVVLKPQAGSSKFVSLPLRARATLWRGSHLGQA